MRDKRLVALAAWAAALALLAAGCGDTASQVGTQAPATQRVEHTQPGTTESELPQVSPTPSPSPEVTQQPQETAAPTTPPTPKPTQSEQGGSSLGGGGSQGGGSSTGGSSTSKPTQSEQGGSSLGGGGSQGGGSSTGGSSTSKPQTLSPSGKAYRYYDTVQPTYLKGVLIVNKTYALPRSYGGYNATASAALSRLQAGARNAGFSMPLLSGYRSFDYQDKLYRKYAAADGVAAANTYSAWPGHSEHQTGLAFDIGSISNNYGSTPAGKWLAAHAHEYGFIIRYPKGKEGITGYQYEPWHVRYLGVELATKVYESGLCLEEYLSQPDPTPTPAPTPTPTPEPTPEPTPSPTPTPEPETTPVPEVSPQPTQSGGET